MIREFCAENFTQVRAALLAGANRIELCDNLAVGGTTPSYGVLKTTLALASEVGVPVMVMIRPRGGNFVYTEEEQRIMLQDLEMAKTMGAQGAVIGALTEEGQLDKVFLQDLILAGQGMQLTFHMAFDQLDSMDQFAAIEWLAEQGVSRILTHGGPAERPIEDHLSRLAKLVTFAQGKMEMMIGGGVTAANCEDLAKFLGISEVHGTQIVALSPASQID